VAIGTVLFGDQGVFLSGVASNNTISSGGLQDVFEGGRSVSTTVVSGGVQDVVGDSIATATTVKGGVQNVDFAGTAISATISGGGSQIVSSGGTAISTTIGGTASGASGIEIVLGIARGTLISNGGTQFVSGGGTAIGTLLRLSSGGGLVTDKQVVGVSGVALSTIIRVGEQDVLSGGTVSGVTNSGGFEEIFSGAVVIGAKLEDLGAIETLESAAVVSGTLVDKGHQYVESGSSRDQGSQRRSARHWRWRRPRRAGRQHDDRSAWRSERRHRRHGSRHDALRRGGHSNRRHCDRHDGQIRRAVAG
jgi:autotransporter passenger strand-loop-strand repeat protein